MTDVHAGPFPPIVNIGIVRGRCQCACVHCPIGVTPRDKRHSQFGLGEIQPGAFRAFCAECSCRASVIRLHGVGEPTLHSQFADLLRTSGQYRLRDRLWLFSNGLFPAELRLPIVENVGIIEFSVNAIDAAEYRTAKGVDRFHEVVESIYATRSLADSRGLATRIVLTRVAADASVDRQFADYWQARGFEAFVRSRHSYSGLLQRTSLSSPVGRLPACEVPWCRFNVDGTLLPGKLVAIHCFNVLFQQPARILEGGVLGLFPDMTLQQIWQGKALKRLRLTISSAHPTGTACDSCHERLTRIRPRAEDFLTRGGLQC